MRGGREGGSLSRSKGEALISKKRWNFLHTNGNEWIRREEGKEDTRRRVSE